MQPSMRLSMFFMLCSLRKSRIWGHTWFVAGEIKWLKTATACATLRDGKTESQSCWTSAWRINMWQLQGMWGRVSQACNKSMRQSIFPRSLMATHDPTVSMRPNHADIPNLLFIDSSFTYSATNMFLSPLLPGVRMLLRALTWLLVLPASQAQVSSQYLINSPFMFFFNFKESVSPWILWKK